MACHRVDRGLRIALLQCRDDCLVFLERCKLALWRAHEQARPIEAAARRVDRMLYPVVAEEAEQ